MFSGHSKFNVDEFISNIFDAKQMQVSKLFPSSLTLSRQISPQLAFWAGAYPEGTPLE
jgi:hypothetical protein